MEKYEIELVDFGPDHQFASLLGILTGLELHEIIAARDGKKYDRWRGAEIIQVLRNLGYNCNSRFVKFDKETEFPCLMRSNDRHGKSSGWYAAVYYDGFIYNPVFGKIGWNRYNYDFPHLRITSMLQVWI